jgi:sigma-B regulation protein RsbU (phosphoserine phosphatase)
MPDISQSLVQTLQDENLRLKRAIEELSVLNDLARMIGGSLNSQEIMQTVIHRSLRAVHAEQGVITLVDAKSGHTMKTLVRSMVSSSDNPRFHFHQNLLGWMHLNKKPLMINQPREDERFRGIQWDDGINQALCAPMIAKSELIGVLSVYNKKDGKNFTDDDQRLLAIIAAQSGQVVENARLYEQEKALVRVQEEIRLASQIQLDLLPKTSPVIPGYDIAATSIPAQMVGGDYFDFIPVDDDRMAICVGDVSGKGLPAAMLMANLQATLRGQTLLNLSAKECITRSNTLLNQTINSEKFATVFYGILDSKNHVLSFSNGGHDNPFFLSGQNFSRLKTGGIPLGMLSSFPYEGAECSIAKDDLLVICSDGISEAWNNEDVQFGDDRLSEVIRTHRDVSASQLIADILSAVKSHVGTAPQMDDMTIMVVKRVG